MLFIKSKEQKGSIFLQKLITVCGDNDLPHISTCASTRTLECDKFACEILILKF